MATNSSEHLGLHLWQPTDQVLRTEFNENWQKIDTAAAGLREDLTQGLEEISAANCLVKLGGPLSTTVQDGTLSFDLSGPDLAGPRGGRDRGLFQCGGQQVGDRWRWRRFHQPKLEYGSHPRHQRRF